MSDYEIKNLEGNEKNILEYMLNKNDRNKNWDTL